MLYLLILSLPLICCFISDCYLLNLLLHLFRLFSIPAIQLHLFRVVSTTLSRTENRSKATVSFYSCLPLIADSLCKWRPTSTPWRAPFLSLKLAPSTRRCIAASHTNSVSPASRVSCSFKTTKWSPSSTILKVVLMKIASFQSLIIWLVHINFFRSFSFILG